MKNNKENKKSIGEIEKTVNYQTKIISQLLLDREKWRNEYNDVLNAYTSVLESPFWKISEPIRKLLDKIKGKTINNDNISSQMVEDIKYLNWIKNNERDVFDTEALNYEPLISVIVPVYNVKSSFLKECIDSVLKQTYSNWQLVLVDDCSTFKSVKDILSEYENIDRIKIIYRDNNGGISEASNTAIENVTGEFICFLDCDDILSPNALYEIAKYINENEYVDFIYSDEDKITEENRIRFCPFFKPDFSPDTLLQGNYITHLSVYRKKLVDKIGFLNKKYDGAQDYDYVLRFTEITNKIGHISKILYHWRVSDNSTAGSIEAKPYAINATKLVKQDLIKRRKYNAHIVEDTEIKHRIVFDDNNQKVSIVIPSKDNFEVLKRCIDSILKITKYDNYEILVVDNGSNEENKNIISKFLSSNSIEYIYDKYDFNFSKMCNIGAAKSSGNFLLFLNDDTEILKDDWLNEMVGQASQTWAGAVGVKLLYPNSNIIQHCGVINITAGLVHYLNNMSDTINHSFSRNKMNYNVIAVTGACLMVEKTKFNKISGFNEDLPNNFNDIDLCFRLLNEHYYNVVLNNVVLYHYESLTRYRTVQSNNEKNYKISKDLIKLFELNPKYIMYDPFYNVNLTQSSSNFELNED